MSSSEEDDTGSKFDDLDLDGDDESSGNNTDPIMEPDAGISSPESETENVGDSRQIEESSPPFGYNAATQDQLYVKEGLEDDLDDLRHEIEHILRKKFDIRNAEIREFDTAITQLLLGEVSVESIAEKVVENRGFNPDVE